MTAFERQVVDALAALLAEQHVRISPEEFSGLVQVLAPRVAAAIEAGAAQTTVNIGLAVGPGVLAAALEANPPTRQWHAAALAALRGGPA